MSDCSSAEENRISGRDAAPSREAVTRTSPSPRLLAAPRSSGRLDFSYAPGGIVRGIEPSRLLRGRSGRARWSRHARPDRPATDERQSGPTGRGHTLLPGHGREGQPGAGRDPGVWFSRRLVSLPACVRRRVGQPRVLLIGSATFRSRIRSSNRQGGAALRLEGSIPSPLRAAQARGSTGQLPSA